MAAKTRVSKKRKTEKQTEARQVVDEEDAESLQAEKEALARDLLQLKDEQGRASVSKSKSEGKIPSLAASVSKCETEVEVLRAKLEAGNKKLEIERKKLKRQRDECLEKELKELELEEEVSATQRKLGSVQQRMIQRTLPPLPKEIYFEVAKHVHESEALAFAMACRAFRDAMKEALKAREGKRETKGKWLETRCEHYGWKDISSSEVDDLDAGTINYVELNYGFFRDFVSVSEDWIKWAFSMEWEYAPKRNEKGKERRKEKFLMYVAAVGGFIDVLQWLKSQGCVLDSEACRGAAFGGQLKVLKYLKSEGVAFKEKTCDYAAVGGHIKALKYLKSEGVWFDEETCAWAVHGGNIDVLDYLKSVGMSFNSFACWDAARGGHIHVLKYLKSEGVAFDSTTCDHAAFRGHLEALKYLKSEGMSFDSSTCHDAAKGGHLDVLKYLKSEGVPFDSGTCRGAARGGHIEVLQWLRSEGCPWDADDCIAGALVEKRGKWKETIEWIESNR